MAVVAPLWIAQRHVPHLLAAGLVLHLYGLATIVSSVVQLLLIGRTYATAPVVLYQRRLAELQRFRAVSALALGLPWWIPGSSRPSSAPGCGGAWISTPIARLDSRVDRDRRGGDGAHGVAGALIARRPPRSPMLRRMIDDLAGHSLVRAAGDLDEVTRFEKEA